MVRPRLRSASGWALLVAAALLIGWLIESRTTTGTGDYAGHGAWGDNAGPAIEAIIHGHLDALPRVQTVMGLTSILWRVPFVAITNALGAGDRIDYAVGALACLAPLLWLVAWMVARDPTRRGLGAAAVAAGIMIAGPATSGAVLAGHPEEILTTVLALAAVLAARADRRVAAAILLGLAIGAKQWALLTAPVVILAVPRRRLGVAVLAGMIGAATTLALPLLDPGALHHAEARIAPVTLVQPMSLWWPLATSAGQLPFGAQRPLAAAAAVALAGVSVCGAGVRLRARSGRSGPRPVDVLALLALAGLLRCLLDPAALGYYFVAATIPLAVWEVATAQRPPAVSVLFWGLLSLTRTGAAPFAVTRAPLAGEAGNAIFLAGAGALVAYLTLRAFAGPLRIGAGVMRPAATLTAPASPPRSV